MEFHKGIIPCESDKQLMLHRYNTNINLKLKDINTSDTETLTLLSYHDQDELESMVGRFPNLRFLNISVIHRTNAEILSILRKCKHLETFVIDSEQCSVLRRDEDEVILDYKLNAHFHDEFIKTIGNPHIKMEIKESDKIIGVVTKDEIIWRDKLLHWVGYDPIHNHSNVQLLDLAAVPKESIGKHKQPLNLIFNYLDLNSLYAFCGASKQCNLLVHSYNYQRCKQPSKKRAKQRSEQRGKFIITDEFGINFNALRLFGKSISNLEIHMLDYQTQRLESEIAKYCKNLTMLCFHTRRTNPHCFILAKVRHYVFYGYGHCEECIFHCDLGELSRKCPNLDILEIKTPIRLYVGDPKKLQSFKNLQRIKFKPYDDSQEKFATEFFKGTATEVIVDHSV